MCNTVNKIIFFRCFRENMRSRISNYRAAKNKRSRVWTPSKPKIHFKLAEPKIDTKLETRSEPHYTISYLYFRKLERKKARQRQRNAATSTADTIQGDDWMLQKIKTKSIKKIENESQNEPNPRIYKRSKNSTQKTTIENNTKAKLRDV